MRKIRTSGSDRRNLKQGIIRGLPGGSHRGRHPGIPAEVGTVIGICSELARGNFLGLEHRLDVEIEGWPHVQTRHLAERPQALSVGHKGAELPPRERTEAEPELALN